MTAQAPASELRKLPSVDRLLQQVALLQLAEEVGRPLVVQAVRKVLELERSAVSGGQSRTALMALVQRACDEVDHLLQPSLAPVLNATGVIIHTNLGRAPLSWRARQAMEAVALGYSNLEYELELGQRGSRYSHAEAMLRKLTGAEGALVVNNNAAAVLLLLSALACGKEVLISRGQLVEIGGGFRIPDVMRQSGARLVEVGATNRTHPQDYEGAIGPDTVALMRVHHSNFKMIGFTQDVSLAEMAAIAHRHNCLVCDDLGSGTLLDTTQVGLEHEPTVQESVRAGADLVSFSGDKLLGGPQAGVIVGQLSLIRTLQQHPLLRALRVDKITLAGLQATLQLYLEGRAMSEIPVWRMMSATLPELTQRAERWRQALLARHPGLRAGITVGQSTIGGGSLPGETLPTALLALELPAAESFGWQLRHGNPPVIGRIENDRFLLDPRTVSADEEEQLLRAVDAALGARSGRAPTHDTQGETT